MSRPPDPTRKPELLDQIVTYLGQNSVGSLSLRKLAAGIGVSTTTLLYHFGSKDELVQEAVRLVEERMREATRERLANRIGDAVLFFFDWLTQPGSVEQFAVSIESIVIARASERHPGFGGPEWTVMWVDMFTEAFRARGFDPEQARLEGTLIHGALLGLCIDYWSSNERERVRIAVEQLAARVNEIAPAVVA
jgi:AcrR family transcriptional regulator